MSVLREGSAFVNRIIPFSSVDGPGNRTAVFLQGCNWDCRYCHNPETRGLCTGCGLCVDVCPRKALSIQGGLQRQGGNDARTMLQIVDDYPVSFDPQLCIMCDACIKACPHSSCPRVTKQSPQQTFDIVKKQMPFIRGVTVSGGECCLYPEYLTRLFKLCRAEGLETMADSNGSIPLMDFPKLVSATDGFMLDVKAYDPGIHEKTTGADNKNVIENLLFLADLGKLFEVRTVVVPGLVDAKEAIANTGRLLAPFQSKRKIRYKIIAYRPIGVRKEYRNYQSPDSSLLKEYAKLAHDSGFEDVVII